VRDKIEGRFATSLGSAELAEGTAEARSLDEQQAQREAAGKAKLDEIRRTLEG
jgi:phage shock protein A